jgi:hypothetical protein
VLAATEAEFSSLRTVLIDLTHLGSGHLSRSRATRWLLSAGRSPWLFASLSLSTATSMHGAHYGAITHCPCIGVTLNYR